MRELEREREKEREREREGGGRSGNDDSAAAFHLAIIITFWRR